eukprot:361382-Chlamydomonas_euryale.AAC.1
MLPADVVAKLRELAGDFGETFDAVLADAAREYVLQRTGHARLSMCQEMLEEVCARGVPQGRRGMGGEAGNGMPRGRLGGGGRGWKWYAAGLSRTLVQGRFTCTREVVAFALGNYSGSTEEAFTYMLRVLSHAPLAPLTRTC